MHRDATFCASDVMCAMSCENHPVRSKIVKIDDVEKKKKIEIKLILNKINK